MNPLLKKSIENVQKNCEFTETQLHFITQELASIALAVAVGITQNTNANLKGGDSIDENTLGNFELKEGIKF